MEKKLRKADLFLCFGGEFVCKGFGWVAAFENDGLRGERGAAEGIDILLSLSAGTWRTSILGSFKSTAKAGGT